LDELSSAMLQSGTPPPDGPLSVNRRTASLGLDRGEAVSLVPALGVLAVWIALLPQSGGFQPSSWLPAGLVLLALLVVAVVGGRRLVPWSPPARVALGLLAAFTAWNFLSIAWSDAPGASWAAANLVLLALLGAWTLALAPWRASTAEAWVALFAVAAAVVCLIRLVQALGATDLEPYFLAYRWQAPLEYPNTSAAFCFMAAIAPLVLSARPGVPVWGKAALQAVATFLVAFGLLPQSRGSVLGGVAALVVLFLVVPFRWRLAGHLLALLIAVSAAAGPVFDVFTTGEDGGSVSAALDAAARGIAVATLVGLLLGLALALAESRWTPGDQTRRTARRGAVAGGALVALLVVALVLVKAGAIGDELSSQWRSLTHPGIAFNGSTGGDGEAGGSRLTDADPLERYDYWRVSLDGFRDAPLAGMGAGGFEHRYVTERRYPKPSKYPHNLVFKTLGDLGVVGLLLAVGAIGTLLWAVLRRLPRLGDAERGLVGFALAAAAYFLAHGEFDWLEAYPVIVGPALGLPFMALTVADRAERLATLAEGGPAARAAGGRRALPPRGALAGAGALAVLAAVSLLGPWLSIRYNDRAVEAWTQDPQAAFADFDRAADANPLDPGPPMLKGVVAVQRGDLATARVAFREALDREQLWLPHLALAAIDQAQGDRAGADRELARAKAISPREITLPDAAKAIRGARKVDPAVVIRQAVTSPLVFEQKLR
jgi:O-antigen ligase